ncbi:unnamed protein product [Mycena citricolor]|uniref:UDP-Glycosyltransferase/glycogen phosphorylase n=1 Tax=Mycena citricolor TaxID=2018698 RepID=A0AAD2HTB2_9AGAR|nr:unnamed protein product [Mycena citricolor]
MPRRHILTLLAPAWGHTLPYIHLTTRMLAQDPELVITIVQHNLILPKMLKELDGCTYDQSRLKIESVGDKEIKFSPALVEVAIKDLAGRWLEILAKAVGAGPTDAAESAWPRPYTVHLDFFGGGFVAAPTRALLGPESKLVLWCSGGVNALPDHLSDYNFAEIAREIYADESRRAGRSMEDILGDVVSAWNGSDKLDGRTIKIVGSLDIYDHEHIARGAGGPRDLAPVLSAAQGLAQVADAIMCPASSAMEPIATQFSREYYKKRNQELFLVGPQMHDRDWKTRSAGPGPSEERIKTFLENARKQFGPGSVLYISFGSLFFPLATPHLVEVMVDVLLTLKTPLPFVFVLAGAMASLPQEIIDRIHASGRGLVCDFWVDQKAILECGTVGWFLTHGGYNSLTESLSQGIPLIFWPVGAEQAVNAAMLSTGPLPIGIELFQIRAGEQLGPSLRSDAPSKITGTVEDARIEFEQTFGALKGARGERLRQNAVHIADLWRKERMDGEPARDIAKLIEF